jgi:hypothetical protein
LFYNTGLPLHLDTKQHKTANRVAKYNWLIGLMYKTTQNLGNKNCEFLQDTLLKL